MVTANAIKALGEFLHDKADPVQMQNGDKLPLTLVDGTEVNVDHDDLSSESVPLIEIEPGNIKRSMKSKRGKNVSKNKQDTTTTTYTSTQDVYDVHEKDISSINSVSGTLNGSNHTFTEDYDFEIFTNALRSLPHAIKWLDGGDTPDEDTEFTIDYNHRLVSETRISWETRMMNLIIHGSEVPSSNANASIDYSKSDVLEETTDFLSDLAAFYRGHSLQDGAYHLEDIRDLTDIGVQEGESTVTGMMQVVLRRNRNAQPPEDKRLAGRFIMRAGEGADEGTVDFQFGADTFVTDEGNILLSDEGNILLTDD
jgi:hypothetical protein